MIPLYLSRPVFDFAIDWSKTPVKRFSYDLREILLGHAAPKFQPLAGQAVEGLEFDLLLEDEAALVEFEAFVDSVKGRLTGFWLASHDAECEYLEPVDTGVREFYIRDQQLRDTFTDHSYLCFVSPAGVRQYGRISNCVLEGTREKVTLYADAFPIRSGDLAPPFDPVAMDATWEVFHLLYVRLADDTTEIEFNGDNWGRTTVKVIELPEEYAAIETGQQPVFLYELAFAGLSTWRYTNLNVDITSSSQAFITWPISHDGHRQALEGGENELTLKTAYDAGSPVAKLFPYPTPRPLSVTVWEIAYATPNTRTVLFTGFVDSVRLKGAEAELRCKTVIAHLGRQFPRFFIQNRCNYALFSHPVSIAGSTPGWCAFQNSDATIQSGSPKRDAWRVTAKIDIFGGRNVRLKSLGVIQPPGYDAPAEYTADFFTFGYLEHRNAAGTVDAIRQIESNLAAADGLMQITLTAPLDATQTAPDDDVYLYPGCDGTHETCRTKFFNFANWGGFGISRQNLAVDPVAVEATTAKK